MPSEGERGSFILSLFMLCNWDKLRLKKSHGLITDLSF